MLTKGHIMVFRDAPLPPSSNMQYVSFQRRGRIIHVRSPELVTFYGNFDKYRLKNREAFEFASQVFSGHPLSVHIAFGFERSRVLTKKGSFKKLDVSNYLKAIHDAFAKALNIDDSMFVRVSAVKRTVPTVEREGAEVQIAVHEFEELQ